MAASRDQQLPATAASFKPLQALPELAKSVVSHSTAAAAEVKSSRPSDSLSLFNSRSVPADYNSAFSDAAAADKSMQPLPLRSSSVPDLLQSSAVFQAQTQSFQEGLTASQGSAEHPKSSPDSTVACGLAQPHFSILKVHRNPCDAATGADSPGAVVAQSIQHSIQHSTAGSSELLTGSVETLLHALAAAVSAATSADPSILPSSKTRG